MPQSDLKLVSLHVVDKMQLEGLCTGRVARAQDVLMLCAGYGGQLVHGLSSGPWTLKWQHCFVTGVVN